MTADAPDASPIALFIPNLGGGGAERVTVNLARGLVESGHRVDLLAASAKGTFSSSLPPGVRLVDLAARRTASAIVPLARYLRRERPRGLISALNHANVIAIAASRLARYRGPVLVCEHNELFPKEYKSLPQRGFLSLIRLTYPMATKVIAVSEGVRESLVRMARVPPSRVEVIYNPVVVPEIFVAMRELPDHHYLSEPGAPVILGIGRLTAQKNFPNLLRAFALVRQRVESRLLILGEGEDRAALTSLAEELGLSNHVSMPGFVKNPYSYLAKAGVFVLSSDWEGLPTVLIEALATGTPVISTDCPSGPREILAGGRNGELVPPGDSEALAAAIERVLDGGHAAVEPSWLEQFTVGAATKRYVQAMGLVPEPNRGGGSAHAA